MADFYNIAIGFTLGVFSMLALKSRFGVFSNAKAIADTISNAVPGRYCKFVVVVRTDLGMGKGKIAAQCSHAAVGCYRIADKKNPHFLKEWLACGQPKIVLKLDSSDGEKQLYDICNKTKAIGLSSVVIHDAGHTQIDSGTATVCGVGPAPADLIDQITGNLKLL